MLKVEYKLISKILLLFQKINKIYNLQKYHQAIIV